MPLWSIGKEHTGGGQSCSSQCPARMWPQNQTGSEEKEGLEGKLWPHSLGPILHLPHWSDLKLPGEKSKGFLSLVYK